MKKLDKAAQERKKKEKEKLQMVGGVNASEAQQHIFPHGKKKKMFGVMTTGQKRFGPTMRTHSLNVMDTE